MKIYFFDVQDFEKTYILEHFNDFDYTILKDQLTIANANFFNDATVISIFLQSKINKEILAKLPKLKLIVTRTTGYEHIDLDQAAKNNITVYNIPTYGDHTVAEYTFGLLLALSRKIIKANNQAKRLIFSHENLIGFDLKSKTLGVVGVGRIGRCVIQIAKGFEMYVIAFDPHIDKEYAQRIGFHYVNSLKELLEQADIITLHAPLNQHTYHMINKDNIKFIKPGAYLINTARGGLIETEALALALDQNILAGAALDVFEYEQEQQEISIAKEYPSDELKIILLNQLLINKENVIISAHNAFNTKEAIMRIMQATEAIIREFINNMQS